MAVLWEWRVEVPSALHMQLEGHKALSRCARAESGRQHLIGISAGWR